MGRMGVKERIALFKNRRMCLETSFRQKENTALWQWAIILICVITLTTLAMEWTLTMLMQDIIIPSRTATTIVGTAILMLCMGTVSGTLYFIFRIYNYRKGWYEFLLFRPLEINTAIVKRVEGKCVTYLENGSVDAEGKPYLIDYHVKVSGSFARKPKVSDIILVLHGEDKNHNKVTRIAMVNDELRKYVSEVEDVADWERLKRYPHDLTVNMKREAWVPSQEQVGELLEKESKHQKEIQLEGVRKLRGCLMLVFGVLAYCAWADTAGEVSVLVLYIAIAELLAIGFSMISRSGGVENINRTTPKQAKTIQEAMYLNPVFAMVRSVELCVWDEEKHDYVQRVYKINNMFLPKKKMGTVYYMLTGIVGEHYLVEK